jgi:hypothetical protein
VDENPKVTIIPIDEEAIRKVRAECWQLWPHAVRGSVRRAKHMSIPEDNWDGGRTFEDD